MTHNAMFLARPDFAHIGANPAARRTIVAHDVDEQAHNLTDWEQRYDQITAGRFFCGVLDEWRNQDVQIFFVSATAARCIKPVACGPMRSGLASKRKRAACASMGGRWATTA